MLELDKVKKIV